eukprot:GHUV01027484.1.p2 GENE.GHUV01027484.1~~GHUV01027484.1.p2  ORF type:complete len:154 (-),score=58.67 GHUV01027484.1:65-526(-)
MPYRQDMFAVPALQPASPLPQLLLVLLAAVPPLLLLLSWRVQLLLLPATLAALAAGMLLLLVAVCRGSCCTYMYGHKAVLCRRRTCNITRQGQHERLSWLLCEQTYGWGQHVEKPGFWSLLHAHVQPSHSMFAFAQSKVQQLTSSRPEAGNVE